MSAGRVRVAAVGRALPEHRYDQQEILAALERDWDEDSIDSRLLARLHRNVKVKGRHLALPLESYWDLDSFTAANDAFIREATELGARALSDGLARAGVGARDVDHIFFVSVTGIATPSIDAALANRLGLRADIKRTPIFGLGCVGGAAGVARASDYLRAYPDQVAVLLCVELCSLTVQLGDASIPNLIASGLFGDGAAAVVLEGAERASLGAGSTPTPSTTRNPTTPRIEATRSVLYPDTEDVMGWTIGEEGFHLVMSADIPRVVREHIGADVDSFLAEQGLDRRDVGVWIVHPGGPRVLDAIERALDLDRAAIARTWRLLGEMGNLSSASVLMVLGDALDEGRPTDGEVALMLAMGPGFSTELVLLRG